MSNSHIPLPDSYEGLRSRALLAARTGNIVESVELLRRLTDRLSQLSEQILQRRPELRDLHRQARLEFTNLLMSEGRYAEAMEVEQVLLSTHPDESDLWRRDLAVLRIAKGDEEAGLAELQALAEGTPDQPVTWVVLGREYLLAGRLTESERALDRARAVCPKDEAETLAQIHLQRFLLYKEMKQLDRALSAWEEAVKLKPEAGGTVEEVVTMLIEAGRFSQAQSYVARNANPLQAGFEQGLIASLTGKPVDAREAWRQVARLDPDQFEDGHDAWLEAVLRLGDPDPALEWLQASLPEHATPRSFVLAGIGWAMRKDDELAAILFQQAIRVMRRERSPRQKLEGADWRLLDALVSDDEIKAKLKPYFAVVETLWG
jgi:tetratricopeptide (TPR) repeat protein